MSMWPARGNWDIVYKRKRASVAFTANTLVSEHSDDDTITPATSSSTILVGIVLKPVASTDSDYASNTRIPVAVPRDYSAEMFCNDLAAAIAVTDENELMDLTDADTINPSASTTKVVKLSQFVSTASGFFKFVRLYNASTPVAA